MTSCPPSSGTVCVSEFMQSSPLASYPGLQSPGGGGGKAWYTLFAHAFNLNMNITSILIVTFANGLGLTDDVCVNTPAGPHESDQRAHNKHTTALSTVYKSLLVARLHEERERLVAQALAIASR